MKIVQCRPDEVAHSVTALEYGSLSYDLVVKGGLVVTAEQAVVADVAVAGERIAAVGSGLSGAVELDAHGLYVIPGAIDGHVHLTDPTFPPVRHVDCGLVRDRHPCRRIRRCDDGHRLRPAGCRAAAASTGSSGGSRTPPGRR